MTLWISFSKFPESNNLPIEEFEEASPKLWGLYSWKNKPIRHQPKYDDLEELDKTLREIENAPKIVSVEDTHSLKDQLKACGMGEKMLVHLGDCAETFKDCNEASIRNRFVLFTLCQLVMSKLTSKKVIKIGRIAGQYAKPRSGPVEEVDGVTISSYFGDNINSFKATKEDRAPKPEKLMKGYHWAVTTYHTIKKLMENKVCDISKEVLEERLRDEINIDRDSTDFDEFIEIIKDWADQESEIENLFTSHEGLLLDYESRLTKLCPVPEETCEKYYNSSAHFLWIGERTNKFNEAHVEYFRGIGNPIGIKVGPKSDPSEILRSFKLLNPENEMGKLSIILRLGAKNVATVLPPLIKLIKDNKLNVVWISDAVHGNTYVNDWKFKVRHVDTILAELTEVYKILTESGQVFGGIHLEASGDSVTECLGGITRTSEDDLFHNYATYCDPRLNFVQTLYVVYKFCKSIEK